MAPKILDEQSLLAREQEIIECALELIKLNGAENLTMDKLVAQVPYSKGTVYNHFSSKEDLLIAISNRALKILSKLFYKASQFSATTRERMYLVSFAYLIYAILHPALFETMLCAKSPTISGKASLQRVTEHDELELEMLSSLFELIQQAIDAGDLNLPPYMTIQQTCFAQWSSSYGVIALLSANESSCKGREELIVEQELFNKSSILLDGLQWFPLSKEVDYKTNLAKSLSQVFSDELQTIEELGRNLNF